MAGLVADIDIQVRAAAINSAPEAPTIALAGMALAGLGLLIGRRKS